MRERPKYNYHDLLSYLSRGRNKNDRPTDKSALLVVRQGGEPCVKLYGTTIARFHEDGTITINAGGWEDSNTTRANIGEVTGASIFSIAAHKRRATENTTRIYVGHRLRDGVPFVDGCIVKRGTCIWHPEMKVQGIDDIEAMTEDKRVINKAKAAPYYAARRALLKRLRPMLHFIDQRVLEGTRQPYRLLDWLEDVLTNPPADDELMQVACHLVDLGAPSDNGQWWNKNSLFDPAKVPEYVQRGLTRCVGVSSWDYLDHIGAIETVQVPCRDI